MVDALQANIEALNAQLVALRAETSIYSLAVGIMLCTQESNRIMAVFAPLVESVPNWPIEEGTLFYALLLAAQGCAIQIDQLIGFLNQRVRLN